LDNLFDLAHPGRPSRSDLAAPIQLSLQQFLFISCKVLCCTLKIDKATCLHVLHDDLHLEKFNLPYVSHSLEADQNVSPVELSRNLLQILEQNQQYESEHILTGDESWFFFEYFRHSCWVANPDDVPEIPKQKLQSESASFRLFGVAQGSKVCSKRHEI
jgi:hypothetical protein